MVIAEAIKNFRLDCEQTQIQFAVALEMSATSIHRYEAGSGVPDLDSLKKLHNYATRMGNKWAEKAFQAEMMKRAGLTSRNRQDAKPRSTSSLPDDLDALSVDGEPLDEKERLCVIALVLLLRHASDATGPQVLDTLLAPWFGRAAEQMGKQLQDFPSLEPSKSER